jgi:hypothetical protein
VRRAGGQHGETGGNTTPSDDDRRRAEGSAKVMIRRFDIGDAMAACLLLCLPVAAIRGEGRRMSNRVRKRLEQKRRRKPRRTCCWNSA